MDAIRRPADVTSANRWQQYVAAVLGNGTIYILLLIGSIVLLFPAVWMISISLKTPAQVYEFPPRLIPSPVVWENYLTAFSKFPFLLYARNSLIVTVVATIGTVGSCSLVAFGFSRRRFPEREFLFGLLLATIMLPGIVTLIPTFVLFSKLGWVNTFLPLTVPSFFAVGAGGAFNVFLLRQFFMTLPIDYDEAAYLDGASSLQVLWRVILPLSKAPLAAITVFTIQFYWNDFMGPLIYMNNPDMRTLAVGLQFYRDNYNTQWSYLMAGATMMLLPVLVLFFAAQRYFMQGLMMTGLSGR